MYSPVVKPSHLCNIKRHHSITQSALKSSRDNSVIKLWKSTNLEVVSSTTLLKYKTCKKSSEHAGKLQSKLPSQGFIISFLLEKSLKRLNSLWSKAQSGLPTNIFNLSIRYLNNTLATKKVSTCGIMPPHLIALSAFSPSHSSMSLLDANRI